MGVISRSSNLRHLSDGWAGVLGTVGSPGWLEEGRKERSGRGVPRGGIYKKISRCQEPS